MIDRRVVTIVQARMGSTRLPGKVLADVHGRPMLARQLERLARARTPHAMVIATTVRRDDDAVCALADELGVPHFRGSEHDVLDRYVRTAAAFDADVVVRVTADCPLIDPVVLDRCVVAAAAPTSVDYASNTLERSYPRGMDVEVVAREALEKADREAKSAMDREHVTRFVWMHPERFSHRNVAHHDDFSGLRWTVDTIEDLELVRAVYADLYDADPWFGLDRLLDHAARNPALHSSNTHVEQKTA